MGAVILNNAVIGNNCLVGAGSLVAKGKTFPPGSLIVGSPAQVKRELPPAAITDLRESAEGYRRKAAIYARSFVKIDV
jgi:carbonic anhydrase/acetyltransferase-like protein (isoleucine patch superfamily)